MKVTVRGESVVARTRERLWALVLDPRVLRESIPGCQSLDETAPRRYHIVLKFGKGPVRGRFHGEAELCDVVETERCRIDVHAKGLPGSVKGSVVVCLGAVQGDPRTRLSWEADAEVHGLLRVLGTSFWEHTARSFVDHLVGELSRR
jgi:hypothetical protein